MSSLRNAVKRKTHKERAQPSGRKYLGLLEKKKDYRLRAKDFERKKKRLAELREKAELRNEDEFYFGMHRQKTRDGVHILTRDKNAPQAQESVSAELARKLDHGYLITKLAHEQKQLERLKSNLHFTELDPSVRTNTVFVDDELEDAEQEDDSVHDQEDDEGCEGVSSARRKRVRVEKAYEQLLRRHDKVQKLENAVQHVELKRHLDGKGRRYKVQDASGDRPARYVWKTERKR